MKTLMRIALRLYPTPWRRRYGNEVRQLIDDGHASPFDLADLVAHAPLAATVRGELSTVKSHLATHPTRVAVVALAIVLPTAVLVVVSVLKYVLGVPGPFDSIEPGATPFVTHPIGETVLILAPYVAFGLAVVPFTRLRVGWTEGRLAARAEASVPLTSLVVGVMSAALIVVMAIYWIAENL
jgi:hypothetical protein